MKRQRGRNNRRNNNNNNQNQTPNLNKSYDSNGPDVKIRGAASTISDKYTAMARDAKTSGNRVKAESYLQHAEHYLRLHQIVQAKVDAIKAEKEAQRLAREEQHRQNQSQNASSSDNAEQSSEKGEQQSRSRSRHRSRDKAKPQNETADNTASDESAANAQDAPAPGLEVVTPKADSNASGQDAPVEVKTSRRKRAPSRKKVEADAAPQVEPAAE